MADCFFCEPGVSVLLLSIQLIMMSTDTYISLVATDMGNATAKFLGLESAPYTQEYSAERIINLVSIHANLRESAALQGLICADRQGKP